MCCTYRTKYMILMSFLSPSTLSPVWSQWDKTEKSHSKWRSVSSSLFTNPKECCQTYGSAVYVHSSISKIVRRRPDLESEAVESPWLEIQTRKSSSLVGNIYWNLAATFDWYDQFVTMMDRAQDCKLNVVLLGDFNTDMQKTNPAWDSIVSLLILA